MSEVQIIVDTIIMVQKQQVWPYGERVNQMRLKTLFQPYHCLLFLFHKYLFVLPTFKSKITICKQVYYFLIHLETKCVETKLTHPP